MAARNIEPGIVLSEDEQRWKTNLYSDIYRYSTNTHIKENRKSMNLKKPEAMWSPSAWGYRGRTPTPRGVALLLALVAAALLVSCTNPASAPAPAPRFVPFAPAFSERNGHAAVAVGGDLYVIGGYDGTNRLNDVWKSSNGGATWAQGIYR